MATINTIRQYIKPNLLNILLDAFIIPFTVFISFWATGSYSFCVVAVAIPAPIILTYEIITFIEEINPLISDPNLIIIIDGSIKLVIIFII